MRAELANVNHCAVSFLSRATVNLSWYNIYNAECILLTKITAAQNEAVLSYHCVRGLYLMANVFAMTIIVKNLCLLNYKTKY